MLLGAFSGALFIKHPVREDRAIHTITLAVARINPEYKIGNLLYMLFTSLRDSMNGNKHQAPCVCVQCAAEALLFVP